MRSLPLICLHQETNQIHWESAKPSQPAESEPGARGYRLMANAKAGSSNNLRTSNKGAEKSMPPQRSTSPHHLRIWAFMAEHIDHGSSSFSPPADLSRHLSAGILLTVPSIRELPTQPGVLDPKLRMQICSDIQLKRKREYYSQYCLHNSRCFKPHGLTWTNSSSTIKWTKGQNMATYHQTANCNKNVVRAVSV